MSKNNNKKDNNKEEELDSKNGKRSGKPNNKHNHKRNGNRSSKGNDIPNENSWEFYAASEQIAKDVASIPFNYISGSDFPVKVKVSRPYSEHEFSVTFGQSLATVSKISYIPSIGITTRKNEGVNMAAVQLYAYIRRSNSGARNYEAPDIMDYGLALKDIYKKFFEIKRLIGLTNNFHYYNHAMPDTIIKSLGIDPVDLRSNVAQYRGELNLYARKINSFAFPKYFKAFDRAAFISSYIFCDSTSPRAQMYVFDSIGDYSWSGTTSETGTELLFTGKSTYSVNYDEALDENLKPLSVMFDTLSNMIDAMYYDEDVLTMSGDILKAFPESELYQLKETDASYVTQLMMDEDVLSQIENMRLLGSSQAVRSDIPGIELSESTNTSFNIRQENQVLTFSPYVTITSTNAISDPVSYTADFENLILNSHKDEPDYRDVLEWSRLMITTESKHVGEDPVYTINVTSCGLEIPIDMMVYAITDNGATLGYRFIQDIIRVNTSVSIPQATYINLINTLQLDWHPVIYYLSGTRVEALGFDSKVTTVINADVLKRINTSAVYGAYFAPNLFNQKV